MTKTAALTSKQIRDIRYSIHTSGDSDLRRLVEALNDSQIEMLVAAITAVTTSK